MPPHVTRRQLSIALLENDGHIPSTAKALGLDRSSVRERIKRDPRLAALLEELDTVMVNDARGNVRKAIAAGDIVTSRWLLERKDPAYRNTLALRLSDKDIADILAQATPEQLAELAADAD